MVRSKHHFYVETGRLKAQMYTERADQKPNIQYVRADLMTKAHVVTGRSKAQYYVWKLDVWTE